jgi:hypothetical protein
VANLQRDIVQIIDFLNEKQAPKTRSPRAVDPILHQMKEKLDGINLKPEKGRRKDLRRIEDAVRALRKIAFSDSTTE